jgi:hypothetical protein
VQPFTRYDSTAFVVLGPHPPCVSGDCDDDGLVHEDCDSDGDSVPGGWDPDSDDDDVPDGVEGSGDADGDGSPNFCDRDSDNDGFIDPLDPEPYGGGGRASSRIWRSLHVGSAHPLGDLDDLADANIHVHADLHYSLTDRFDLVAMLGLSQLTAESAAAVDHPRFLHGSLDLRAYLPAAGAVRRYAQLGAGVYRPKSGPNEPGFNLGIGVQVPLFPWAKLEAGIDAHQVQTDDPARFVAIHLGLLFR